MIENFWNWIISSVSNALNMLVTMYNNSALKPFYDLLIIVFAVGMTIKLIIAPLLGLNDVGSSDKAKKGKSEE